MPFGQELYHTDEEKTALEERSSRLQVDETARLIEEMAGKLAITPEITKQLQAKAIHGTYT